MLLPAVDDEVTRLPNVFPFPVETCDACIDTAGDGDGDGSGDGAWGLSLFPIVLFPKGSP
jgi:hypothetical protein